MEIADPETLMFVPLNGASDLKYTVSQMRQPDEFSFRVDWTQIGAGQELLRNHIRRRTLVQIRDRGRLFRGVIKYEQGMDGNDGLIVVTVR